ncbi:hypothetical protein MVEN_00121200 [Mycena venus]|uniref:Uncharacterized protein n=1 Tax=Mycena venus TaxID=2733690 RepID=A0A8H6Z7T3_9AGAR|nr:hypothetical protein MVEN_00121200 [Mycena venus]
MLGNTFGGSSRRHSYGPGSSSPLSSLSGTSGLFPLGSHARSWSSSSLGTARSPFASPSVDAQSFGGDDMSSSSSPLAVCFPDLPNTSGGYFGNVSNSESGVSMEALSRHETLSYDVHFMKEDINSTKHDAAKRRRVLEAELLRLEPAVAVSSSPSETGPSKNFAAQNRYRPPMTRSAFQWSVHRADPSLFRVSTLPDDITLQEPAVQPTQTPSAQPGAALPAILPVQTPLAPTPALPARELEEQEDDLFASVVVRPPPPPPPSPPPPPPSPPSPPPLPAEELSTAPPSPPLPPAGGSDAAPPPASLSSAVSKGKACRPTPTHFTPRNLCMAVYADDVGGSSADFAAYWSSQVADSSLSIKAYETYSKELKNTVPKPKCIPPTQVIRQRIVEILADTAA